jgi:hypothetical protein
MTTELRRTHPPLGTGVKIALVEELFSWFWGGPARAMSHLGE